jgi:hypothetical protein
MIAAIKGFETGTPPDGSLLGVDHTSLVDAYLEAISWSVNNSGALQPPSDTPPAQPTAARSGQPARLQTGV